MTRRALRENIFRLLFRSEFYDPQDMPEQISLFSEELEDANEADRLYITEKTQAILGMIPEIDAAIDAAADRWKTSRMGKVELTVLRLAWYEMKLDDDVPVSVAIDEAVELAKRYGQDSAGSFVNAVLAKLV